MERREPERGEGGARRKVQTEVSTAASLHSLIFTLALFLGVLHLLHAQRKQ